MELSGTRSLTATLKRYLEEFSKQQRIVDIDSKLLGGEEKVQFRSIRAISDVSVRVE